ncbi:alpha/beta fold hydrolase [Tahibacter amnicola]|uniref:Alpha/beta fold hydrolase n=1 Tax=Tahibacter amnicola TaxID=2976241 RepID=A0ABY6BEJ1_9GAMM|nr:alpha/beta fold hydrolase [Tahibacter amnicola]UXI68448.1 alpha/beta fold hydrolase [Tahibacter amnicola]
MAPLPDYPFNGRRFTHASGLVQHYLDEGPRTAPPVLMLHGNPSWSYYWRRLVLALRGDFRCIVPDHIGMGLSDKPDDGRYQFTLQSRVDDLDALIEHLIANEGAPASGWTLVLHDWGGMIGMAWACRRPDRVARLIVTNTAAFPNPRDQKLPVALRLGRDSKLGEWLILGHNAFARGAARWGVTRKLDAPVRDALVSPYDTPANRLSTLRFVQDIPLSPADRAWPLVESTGKALAQFDDRPMLLGWGMRDFVFDPLFLAEWQRRFPKAEVQAYADAGHYVLEDAHERLVPAVQGFLARTA